MLRLRFRGGAFAIAMAATVTGVLFTARRDAAAQAAASGTAKTRSVTPPKPLETAAEYPADGSGEADVVLDLTVDAAGRVTDAALVTGAEPFASAALRAARSWLFAPAARDGRPLAARIRYSLHFEPPAEEPAEAPEDVGAAPAAPAETPVEAPTPASREPLTVIVRAERAPGGSVRITRSEVRNLPGAFGDPLRAIEAQPGVVPIASGLPSFFIRGAPPANVGFYIDGVDVPLLYHAFFGPSVVHPSMLESIDLYRGAAPVEYGRFAGPVVAANLTSLEPRWSGEASLRLIDAGALAQIPLAACPPSADPDCAPSAARLSGRYSYTGLVLSLLTDAQLDYWDYQGQASYGLGPHDALSVLGFGAYDYFQAGGSTEDEGGGRVQFHRIDLRYDHGVPSGTSLRVAVTGGYDRTGGADDTSSTVSDHSLRARAHMTTPLASRLALHAGIDARVARYALETNPLLLSFPDYTTLFPARTESDAGAYLAGTWKPVSGVAVIPGIRVDRYTEGATTAVGIDPRIAASIAVGPQVTVEHSFGIAHQRPNFAAGIPGAEVADLKGGLVEAWLWSSEVTWRTVESITVSAGVFQSAYFNALDPIGGARDFSIDRTVLGRRSTIVAEGLELGISRPLTRKLGGFIGYTLSHSRQSSPRGEEVSGFDRPHVLQAALSYEIGAGLRAGVRAILYSGVPELNYEGSPHFTAERRGPPYFRTDVRIEKRWRLGESGFFAANAEVLNATSTREVVRLDCGALCVQRTAGPVILPSVGVEAGFGAGP